MARQPSGVKSHCLARLQVNLGLIPLMPVCEATAEQIQIIPRPGDVMPSPEIEPAATRQPGPEFFFHSRKRTRQGLGPLFAQGMEMQARNAFQSRGVKIPLPDAQGASPARRDHRGALRPRNARD